MRARSVTWWLKRIWVGCGAVLVVGMALDGAWVMLTLTIVITAMFIADERRGHPRGRSTETAVPQEWTPDRVKTVTAGLTSEVTAVRAVRKEDPGLSLLDAVQLVRGTPAA